MQYQRYLAELLGAFGLTFVVLLSIAYPTPLPTPVMAGLTLALFVYTIGRFSGAHLNPAVTIGILSIGKISPTDAVFYILAQLLGAIGAMALGALLSGKMLLLPHGGGLLVGTAEALGTFVLAFGVTAAVKGRLDPSASGVIVGLSLFIGISIAMHFSNGVLNPAVALGIGSFGPMYVLGPIVGAIAGAFAYDKLFDVPSETKKSRRS